MQHLEGVNHCTWYVRICIWFWRDIAFYNICVFCVTFLYCVLLSVHPFVGELQQILSQDRHPSYSAEFYSSYINILLGVFYSVCRDLRELRHLVRHAHTLISQWRFFIVLILFHHWFLFFILSTRRPSTFQSSANRWQKEKVKHKEVHSSDSWSIFKNTLFYPFSLCSFEGSFYHAEMPFSYLNFSIFISLKLH